MDLRSGIRTLLHDEGEEENSSISPYSGDLIG